MARTDGLTVRCACGYTFCSSCVLAGLIRQLKGALNYMQNLEMDNSNTLETYIDITIITRKDDITSVIHDHKHSDGQLSTLDPPK